ncbi:MAG: ABC transporter ATP-binding protein [Spartobacteria bacterium]|nr:ABC transporter ATP-binding protein [Spartobacteria bacterium]
MNATPAPLLQINDLKTWFPIKRGVFARTSGYLRAVDGVTLHIHEGETLGLVGESGCGKTTLARTVLRLEKATSGQIFFDGIDVLGRNRAEMDLMRRHMQVVFQDPFASLNPRMSIVDLITEGAVHHRIITRSDARNYATDLLDEVGLGNHALDRYPHEFSGGQRQRISIARALAMQPKLIICDEAVSALDVSVQAQVINLFMDLRDRRNLSYLFISHDLSVVRHLANRIAVMYFGQIVESGPATQVIDHPVHPYTEALISAIPSPMATNTQRILLTGDVPSLKNPPPGCRFHPRCPIALDCCTQTMPNLRITDERNAHQAACLLRGNQK